ncbi:hypothetical protein MY4824_003509 [Beauveria thailandica]
MVQEDVSRYRYSRGRSEARARIPLLRIPFLPLHRRAVRLGRQLAHLMPPPAARRPRPSSTGCGASRRSFDGMQSSADKEAPLPWLEAAVVFYATERCRLDAWTWAASQMDGSKDGAAEGDEDGGRGKAGVYRQLD